MIASFLFATAQGQNPGSSSILHTLTLDSNNPPKEPALYLRTSQGYQPLQSGLLRRGPTQYPSLTDNQLSLYHQEITPEGPRWLLAKELPLPGGDRSRLLLIFPQDRASPILIDDSAQAHPHGSIRMLNLTSHSLVGMVGEERFSLNPGENRVTPVEPLALTPIRLAVSHEGQWVPIKSITTRVRDNRRILCLGRFVQADGQVHFDMTPVQDRL